MDPITRYLNRIAYKFPKGYPDMNNKQDILLLEQELSKLGVDVNLNEVSNNDAEEGIEILKKQFGFKDEDFVKQSSITYKLLVPKSERLKVASDINKLDDFDYDPNMKGSSIGGVKFKNAKFLLKPTGGQGRASAGTENEDILENEIKKYIEQGATILIFDGVNKSYTIEGLKGVKGVGYDVAGGKKADVVIEGNTSHPISIKKDNAGFWESSDTRYKSVVNTLSKKIKNGDFAPELTFRPFITSTGYEKEGINVMYDETTDKKVTGVIVTDLPENQEESIIFGSDNAVVVYRSYTPSDFTLEGDVLRVEVSKIIEDMNDVEEFGLEPVLNIRHDSTRAATGGLRATVVPKKLIYKGGDNPTGDKIELSYNEIMS